MFYDTRSRPLVRCVIVAGCVAMFVVIAACGGGYASFPSYAATTRLPVSGTFSDTAGAATTNDAGDVAVSISSHYDGTVGGNAGSFAAPISISVDGMQTQQDAISFSAADGSGSATATSGTSAGTATTGTSSTTGSTGSMTTGVIYAINSLPTVNYTATTVGTGTSTGTGSSSTTSAGTTTGTSTTAGSGGGTGPGLVTQHLRANAVLRLTGVASGSHAIVVSFLPIAGFAGSLPAPLTLSVTLSGSANG